MGIFLDQNLDSEKYGKLIESNKGFVQSKTARYSTNKYVFEIILKRNIITIANV